MNDDRYDIACCTCRVRIYYIIIILYLRTYDYHGQQGTPRFGEICSSAMLRVIFCANGHANVLIRWKKHVLCVLDKKCSHSLHKNGEKRHFFNASHVTLKTDCFIIIITSSIFGIGKIPARMLLDLCTCVSHLKS